MYKAEVKFLTEITENITDTQTTIPVKNIDEFPDDFPNIATFLDRENRLFETIEYTGKSGDLLTGVTRAIEGVARNWEEGTTIGRFHTALEQNFLVNKTGELEDDIADIINSLGNKAEKDGDYLSLRARGTTKNDVGLGNVDNYSRDDYDERYASKEHNHTTEDIEGLDDMSDSSKELIPVFAFSSTKNLSYNSEDVLVQVEEIRTSDNWKRVEELDYNSEGDLIKVTTTLYDNNDDIQKQIEEELNYQNGDLSGVSRSVIV